MSVTDFERMHFAYSPLTEVAESLYMLHSGDIHPLHRGWFERACEDLRRVDTDVLRAIVPTQGYVARFLLGGTVDAGTSIEQQLHLLAGCRLRGPVPPAVRTPVAWPCWWPTPVPGRRRSW